VDEAFCDRFRVLRNTFCFLKDFVAGAPTGTDRPVQHRSRTDAFASNSAGIVLKDVTALANGDLFAVGETANDFAGMKNQTRELTNLQVLGTDIAVAHIGLRP